MRFVEYIRKALLPLLILTVGLAACATGGMSDEEATAMFRVENDTPVRYMTISLENSDGNLVPLGNVNSGETETFLLPVDASFGEYKLVAEAPSTVSSPDIIISESFMTSGGMTVNWYLLENELEVN